MVEAGFAVNVDKTVENRFILNPTNEVVLNADILYSVEHSVIHIGIEDVKAIIDTAENVIILSGNALGKMSIADAIEDVILHSCSVAQGYDLFTADKVLVQISYGRTHPMFVAEAADVVQFAEMFPSTTSFIWGVAEDDRNEDERTVRIMASNLKKKNN